MCVGVGPACAYQYHLWKYHDVCQTALFSGCAGDCSNPAYLANVCVAKAAQRQGVGRELIHNAVDLANQWSTRLPSPLFVLSTLNRWKCQLQES